MSSRYGLEIRAAAPADSPGLAELLRDAGLDAPPRALANRLETALRQPGIVLLAVDWGPPSGVIAVHWAATLQTDALTARVSLLLVAPDDRRRGVARLLLKAASQAARAAGCAALHLSAPAEAASLRAFAEATGFTAGDATFVRPLRKRSVGG